MLGCPLDQAFATEPSNGITIKKEKRKKKDKKSVIYEDELRPVNDFSEQENDFSAVKQRLQSLTPYDDKYSPYEPINREQRIVQPRNPVAHIIKEPPADVVQISNAEYQRYKDFQNKRYSNNQIVEGFDSINDNFNDIILFALTGIFFIIFTDYIYKLGKKSY